MLVEAGEQGVVLTCSDGSMTIQTMIPAEVKEEGRTVLPGRLFTELVRKLPGDMVSVKTGDSGRAVIQCLSSRSSLNAMNPV